MTDLDKALAALRASINRVDPNSPPEISFDALTAVLGASVDLIAALDAARGEAVAAVPDGGFAIVPADALREVIRISDRSHPAWDAVKAAMLAATNKENNNGNS